MAGSKKKSNFKDKKIYYRRAEFSFGGKKKPTLQNLINDAFSIKTTVASRTFETLSGAEISCADYDVVDGSLFLHLSSCFPDEPTSLIPKKSAAKKTKTSSFDAPAGQNFLNGDAFILVNSDHILICPSGVRDSILGDYLKHLFHSCGFADISETLDLVKIAKADKISMIEKEGVKRIDLNSSLYLASKFHSESENAPQGLLKSLAHEIKSMFKKDSKLKDLTPKENLNVTLSLTFDKRQARSKMHSLDLDYGVSGKARLKDLATSLVKEDSQDDESGFSIITNNGNVITPEEIRVSDTVSVKKSGKSIDKRDAWDKLDDYYGELKLTGVLSQ